MHRIVLIILLFHLVDSQQCSKLKKWEKKKPMWNLKQEMKNQPSIGAALYEVESSLDMLCNENLNKSEIYNQNEYILKYYVPGVNSENVKIEAVHRLLYARIGVKEKREEQELDKYVEDLQILPISVNISDAFWNVEDSFVVITLSYKNKCSTGSSNWSVSGVPNVPIEYYSMVIEDWMLR